MTIAQNLSWRSGKVIDTHTTQVCNPENCQPATIRGLQGSMGTGGWVRCSMEISMRIEDMNG
jgi:hypothetical protein